MGSQHKELDTTERLHFFTFSVKVFPGGARGKELTCECKRLERCGCRELGPQPRLALDYNMGHSLLVSDKPLPGKGISGKQEDYGEACPRLWNV